MPTQDLTTVQGIADAIDRVWDNFPALKELHDRVEAAGYLHLWQAACDASRHGQARDRGVVA